MISEDELASAINEAQHIHSTATRKSISPTLLFEVLRHRQQARAVKAITEGLDALVLAVRDGK